MDKQFTALEAIGKEFKQNNGHVVKIIKAYKDAKYHYYRVDIEFEDGTIAKNKLYSEVTRGRVGKPKDYSSFIGTSKINNSGDLVTIVDMQSKNDMSVQFEDGTIVSHVDYQAFISGQIRHPNYLQRKYIGMTNIATNGMKIEIIDIKSLKDVTVKFEDGTIVEHKVYSEFKSGKVGHPDTRYGKIDHTNETVRAKNGLKATILKYNNVFDFDVQFEDGVITHCKNYYNFKSGIVKHPSIKVTNLKNRVGEESVNVHGKKMVIIRYGTTKDIDVQLEDGTIIKNRTYNQFKTGHIVAEKACRAENFVDRVGEQSISKSGRQMTIIAYRKASDIDIQFDDGEIVKHKSYSHFKTGSIAHPDDVLQTKSASGTPINKRVGEQVVNNGILMTIKEYRSSRDIDLELEDGTILKHQVYRQFRLGKIGQRLCADKIKIGQTSISNNGMQIKIVAYNNYNDMTVQFEDGALCSKVSYGNFIKGHIMHPNDKQEIQSREGRTIKLKNGLNATIINYKNARNLEIKLEDNTVLKNKSFKDFGDNIGHPKFKTCKHVGTFNNEKIFLCTCRNCGGKHCLKLSEMKDFECAYKGD